MLPSQALCTASWTQMAACNIGATYMYIWFRHANQWQPLKMYNWFLQSVTLTITVCIENEQSKHYRCLWQFRCRAYNSTTQPRLSESALQSRNCCTSNQHNAAFVSARCEVSMMPTSNDGDLSIAHLVTCKCKFGLWLWWCRHFTRLCKSAHPWGRVSGSNTSGNAGSVMAV